MAIWSIGNFGVFRRDQRVATISRYKGGWQWEGFGIRRYGFDSVGVELLDDVKYYYRYYRKPYSIYFNLVPPYKGHGPLYSVYSIRQR